MKTTVLAISAIFLGILAVSFSIDLPAKKEVNLDPSVRIINFTAEKELTTMVNKGIQILKIKDITVVITELSPEEMSEETLMGYIDDQQTYFLVKLRPGLSQEYYLEIIAHEITHLKDLHSGRLKQLYYGFLYDDVVYTWNSAYYDRLFELEAFEQESTIKMQIMAF